MRRCLILLHAVARAATRCDESRLVRRPDYAERLLRAAIQCNASRIASRAAVANLAVAGTGSQTLADALQAWRGVVGSRRGARPAGVPRLPRRRLLLGEAARRGGARVTPRATAHRLISHHDHRITVDHLLRTTKRWSTALDTFGEPQENVDVFLLTLRDPVRRFQSGWRYRPDFRGYGTLEKLLGAWRAKLGDRRPSFPDGLASSFRRLNTAVNQYFATPQLSYLVGSACACRRGQVRLRVLCTESLRRDLPALAAELGARASHRHSNLRTTRRPRRNATATVSAETAAWLRDMYREDVALHKYYCS